MEDICSKHTKNISCVKFVTVLDV